MTGGDDDLLDKGRIGVGGFGAVHKVYLPAHID